MPGEQFKAGVHAMSFGLCWAMGLYNLAAWAEKKDAHHAMNVGIYAAIAAWEWINIKRHLECHNG